MWSGPRNLSTALMRSFENRNDTIVHDEPFYAYYLFKTQLNHPMKNEIIKNYPCTQSEIIKRITNNPRNKIYYQKHMTHHIVCLLYTSPSPRDVEESRMPSSA